MAKKAKKKPHSMPKLGFGDLCLYWAGMGLTFGGSFAVMLASFRLRDAIAFADGQAVAAIRGRGSENFLFLVFWLLIAGVIILAGPYQSRYPVFGRKDIKYGPPAYPRIYPLLMKNKPKFWVSPRVQARKKTERRVLAGLAVVTLVFSLAMFPRSLYGREVLYRDGTVAVFSPGDRKTEHYKFSAVTEVELDTYYHTPRRSFNGIWYWGMTVRFSDGEEFCFSNGTFRGSMPEILETALELKNRFGSLVTISSTGHLPDVIRDQALTPEEAAMLRQLFGVE